MSAASTAAPQVTRSTSRRQQASYNPQSHDRVQRASSSSKTQTTAPGVGRSNSQSQHHRSVSASGQQLPQGGVSTREPDPLNAARPQSSRRSTSRDPQASEGTPRRSETRDSRRTSTKTSNTHTDSKARDGGQTGGDGAPPQTPTARSQDPTAVPTSSGSARRRTTIVAQTGEWSLGKTIGQGSMGKVKLAKNLETGEQVAIKIVPRQSTDEHRSERDRERADHSKEVRTAREAAIVTLLNHPYICGMRDVVRTNYHWYMMFEYVNGGQMLDYIISHGRLKEKQARKFGRQIASALDYCHRNSIVHRDLKIENILISKTGDIKIIDFGLSNLFSPRNSLKTFCGSLYFAAPELLQARQYTGPEVDVWSFGIVLYVLVCGKVPFDDQSMPQLHAKIKKGVVDYPNWLSPECKNLISRMLVTDPKQRASLNDIMNHAWMTKGFNTPPESFLPHREPLQLPLDPQVIDKMTGFDFGPADFITRELTKVLSSDEYQHAVRLSAREQAAQASGQEKKRGVFDFYKRRNSTTSRDTLPNTSSEMLQLGTDPVNAFSPLISIYYLVREKQDRERIEVNPGALAMPVSPGDTPIKIPDLQAPEAAYTNSYAQEMPGEKATGGRTRARSRTQGEDDVVEDLKKVNLNVAPGTAPSAKSPQVVEQTPSSKRESTGMGLLRRFSTRRGRDSRAERIVSGGQVPAPAPAPAAAPSLQLPASDLSGSPRKSFSVRRSRTRESVPAPIHQGGSTPHQTELLTPDAAGDSKSRSGNMLDRSASVNSADRHKRLPRRGVSDSANLEPPMTSGSERSSIRDIKPKPAESTGTPDLKSTLNAPTAGGGRALSLGHGRRESMQARRTRRAEAAQEADVPEETRPEEVASPDDFTKSSDNLKPVYLKGLFSVSTTSNKPLPVIRTDIIRVLQELGVDFTEIKGGFNCRHAPSIDMNRQEKNLPPSPDMASQQQANQPNQQHHKRRISFAGGFRSGMDKLGSNQESPTLEKPLPERTKSHHRSQRLNNNNSFAASSGSESEAPVTSRKRRSLQFPGATPPPPPPPNATTAGETTTQVQNDLGGDMILIFEILIVKVPWFRLHGIQFKKIQGGTWQYKDVAGEILAGLKL